MNSYNQWVKKNYNNPNRKHKQTWIDDNTIEISGWDIITGKGIKAIFTLDCCEKIDMGIYNFIDVLNYELYEMAKEHSNQANISLKEAKEYILMLMQKSTNESNSSLIGL
jgi:hypothetical protein